MNKNNIDYKNSDEEMHYEPNQETVDSIEASEQGEGLHTFDSMEELLASLDFV